ncbi:MULTISPECIES: alpha-ketoacid dehydrogenase subunit beta [Sphingobium]|uniref:alpha-ketoacid dehydrogenase subunit beta n=1 Tax=Sphingobium sp. MI1205 TaxID=407020 RepID=UPI00077004EA|nr:transketolase C-terminal domain-containing protein [Sphingobium sp. MI1205]AMK19981.1 pyruvate dehydrogenase [Sphingobium sp. MI1205]
MTKRRYTQAINDALFEEMERDPKLFIFGEDIVASYYGDTRGLLDRFGPERVRDTPISEAALTSMAAGAAMAGGRVVCHLMFSNFAYLGMDGIANQIAKMRVMSGGQARLPITFLAAEGGGTSTGAQHSDTAYPMFMNVGGIEVVVPCTPADAKGMLKTALRNDNPTMYMMPRVRCGSNGEVPDGDVLIPFGEARIHREGRDVTIVAIGSCVAPALAAAETLMAEGIDAEVLDPRSLVPLDEAAILRSVEKTGRLVIVDEARDCCSAASHIAAVVADKGFGLLRAPVRRVTTPDIALPYAPGLEKALIPDVTRIAVTIRSLAGEPATGGAR